MRLATMKNNKIPGLRPLASMLLVAALAGCSQTVLKPSDTASTENFTPSDDGPNPFAGLSQTSPGVDVASVDDSATVALLCRPDSGKSLAPPDFDNVWDRIRYGFQLNLGRDNRRIRMEMAWFQRHQHYLDRVVQRSRPYIYYVAHQVASRHMPMELALLPVVESAYDPFAYSHGRASGMWQFIPGTGKLYGLKQNWWYDGRRDIRASTNAALDYLGELADHYDGDWLLALAAYNAGQGNVDRAVRHNARRGKPTDFWSLSLPQETRTYVPRLLAIAKLLAAPDRFNVSFAPVPNKPYFAAVDVGSQIDLAQAASLAGIKMKQLYELNPGFNRWATDPRGPHELLVPVDRADAFSQKLASLPKGSRLAWAHYKIRRGDTLSTIAKRFRTRVADIRRVNHIHGYVIRAGHQLIVPVASARPSHYALSAEQRIASIQGHSHGTPGSSEIRYRVQSGDSLWTISRRYHVTVGRLAKWNGMAPADTLKPGRTLTVWTKSAKVSNIASNLPAQTVRRVGYTVHHGDSLSLIASKFNLRIGDILKWNSIDRGDYLHPGQRLTLYIDVTNAF